ncbi:peptide ABC transporter substrate-binding protein [Litorilinea aerophila]|uniref:Peptide ABC transporter substrate-binding protein n=1 Tax=Litorilinea aerophila TaxID=1204385 RepID=A0A540VMP4_9CHLR|nr:peptide ABC transporter substrate-binding protein [Litorilinea aerophila]MCC9074749.1 peptide ABC transporter substrate-binding protein [Litorilinea aerophila]
MYPRYRIWLWFSLLALVTLVAGACVAPQTTAPPAEAPAQEAPAAPADEEIVLDTVFGTEPPTLDPALATDSQSIWSIRQMFVGLTGFDEQAQVVPSLATEWSASEDGLVWTYTMRDDVHWVRLNPDTGEFEDLGPVTAHDVEYGVKRTLDPNTASDYAYVLYIIQGAEEFNTADPNAENFEELRDAVGVRAIDDTTVEFTLTAPAGYFPSITGLWVTFPQPQEAIEANPDGWADAGSIVTNGPYTLAQWDHGAYIRLVKNPLWVDADNVQIEAIQGPIIESASTAMAMYEANEIDMMADPGWPPPLPDMDRIKADPELSQQLFIAPRLCTYYYGFVNTKPPFDNPLVRKAFAAAIDRKSLINNLTKGEERPAHSFAPPGVFGNVADDMSIGGWMVQDDYAAQLAQAQEWLAEAGYPEGAGINVTLMHNTSEAHAQIAQAIQAMWAEAFPQATVTIENQEWQVYLKTLVPDAPDEEKPEIYRLGWCADYPDQNNWVNEVFNSKSGQNYAKYNNPEFDAVVEQAARESDPAVRQELYKEAERLLIDQDTAISPIYYYTYVRLYKPWLTKVVISPVTGDPVAEWEIDWEAKKAARGQ